MINPNLLTETEAARLLNCSVHDLSQHEKNGEIECVHFRDSRMYRISRQPQLYPKPSPKSDVSKIIKQSVGIEADKKDFKPVEPKSLSTKPRSQLVDQLKERGKIIQLMEKTHLMEKKGLISQIKRLIKQRLVAIIALELLIGATIMGGTMAYDEINASKVQVADFYLMANHQQEQLDSVQAQNSSLMLENNKVKKDLRHSKLENVRLDTQLAIQEVKISQARRMISKLVKELDP